MMARVLGVDVSHWNGTITTAEWTQAKNGGFVFAWAKATQGTGFVDDQFVNNETNAKAAGVKIGGYHFAQWNANLGTAGAQAEADHFWSIISPYVKTGGSYLQPMLDIERVTVDGTGGHEPNEFGYNKTTFSQWINDFQNRMVALGSAAGLNVVPVIYCGTSFSANWIDSTVAAKWPLWRSSWNGQDPQTGAPTTTSPWQTDAWQFWQYSDQGTIPGIGDDDVDVLNGDIDVLQDYIVGSVGRWADGARVDVTATSVKAWATSAANTTSVSVPNGTVGTVLQGPVYGNSYQRWQIQWDNGVVGWCAEDLMNSLPLAATTPSPANNAVVNVRPATFSWTGNIGATSYDVYHGGVLDSSAATASWSPTGAWADGVHTWRIDARNTGATAAGTTWSLTLDTTAPTASYGGQTPAVNAATMDFTVTYADATTALDATTFNTGDLLVTGPGGFSQAATLVGVNTPGNGSPRIVTYRINAPGGTWNAADSGTYTVAQQASQVKDTAGNYRAAGTIGTFTANATFAYMTGTTLKLEFDGSATAIELGGSGSELTATRDGTTLSFSSVGSIMAMGTASADNLQIAAAAPPPLTFINGNGNDGIEVTAGSYVLGSALPANVGLAIKAGASATLNSNQNVRTLSVAGTLNLANRFVTLTDLSALGGWSGTAYTGLLGDIAGGRIVGAPASGVGIATIAGRVRVIGTSVGDANLDKVITGDDYFQIDAHAGQVGGDVSYSNGDFNLDGRVDADDYFAIDANYSRQPAQLAAVSTAALRSPAPLAGDAMFQGEYFPNIGLQNDVPMKRLSIWDILGQSETFPLRLS